MATEKQGRRTRSAVSAKQPRRQAVLRKEPRSLALAVGAALLPWTFSHAYADAAVNTLPTGGQYAYGSGSIAQDGASKLQVTQTTDKGTINWNSFSIGSGAWVNFSQPSASSITVNRVLGNNPSEIFGRMTANGQVFLSNPSGVLFAPGASVDVGSLFATTLTISDQDANAGRYTNWSNPGNAGAVVNQGSIITANGYTALAAPQVRNDGVIVAHAGSVTLAAGDQVSLDMIGDGLIKVTVDEAALNASAINTGSIQADGGNVVLTARSANALLDTVVNNSGEIRANSMVVRDGFIELDGGTAGVVSNTGTLQAAGVEAGTSGGTVKVLGDKVGLFDGTHIDASGDAGGGSILVGGNSRGAGPDQNASHTFIGSMATLNADAINSGNGGNVAVWSNDNTQFYGGISARGGLQGGNGGFVEVSGLRGLSYHGMTDTRAPQGTSGTLLLDPTNIYIAANQANATAAGMTGVDVSADAGAGLAPTIFAATGAIGDSLLTTASLTSALATSRVLVTTTNAGAGANGDIFVVDPIAVLPDSFGLTLRADRNISLLSGIDMSAASVNSPDLALVAIGGSISGNGTLAMGTGSLLLRALTGIGLSGSPINTTGTSNLAATSDTAGIFISNSGSGDINLSSVTNTDTAITVSGLTTTTSGN
ncbi:MAG: filamentous hemagglutinin N-terminal domain-containing protein, partial [Bryobacteraceae bacterium]